MTTVTAARKSCGAVVCTQDSTSRGNEPRLAGRPGGGGGEDEDDDNDDDAMAGAPTGANELLLFRSPSAKRGLDVVEDADVAADRARRWEGVGDANAAAVAVEAAAEDGSTTPSACRDAGRRTRVNRNIHTLGENSGNDPNSCARRI